MSGTHSERPLHLCKSSTWALWKVMVNYAWYKMKEREGVQSHTCWTPLATWGITPFAFSDVPMMPCSHTHTHTHQVDSDELQSSIPSHTPNALGGQPLCPAAAGQPLPGLSSFFSALLPPLQEEHFGTPIFGGDGTSKLFARLQGQPEATKQGRVLAC